MIHIKSITIEKFKGIERLSCEFDDLTVLAGPNNSGKTSILQAVHLVVWALGSAIEAPEAIRWHPAVGTRGVSLIEPLSLFGMNDSGALQLINLKVDDVVVTATFVNDVSIEFRLLPNRSAFFTILVEPDQKDRIDQIMNDWAAPRSEPLTAPGNLPTSEEMQPYQKYMDEFRWGRMPRFWRNSFWWALQLTGPEAFQPLANLVHRYFPKIELKYPRLSPQNNNILVEYTEDGRGPFDVYQSGEGLRSFISLARMLEVSTAEIVLLDEPDAHLHASQQAHVIDLLMEAAQGNRQVILTTHSPEIISRAPVESLRWIERGTEVALGGDDAATMLERLGATPDLYLPLTKHPDVIVYVEGKTDKPVVESLIRWCRTHHEEQLPTVLVIPHRDGRFDAEALQAVVRTTHAMGYKPSVIGLRDLDWYYDELPPAHPDVRRGEGYVLVTLPVKEIENLFCDPKFLHQALGGQVPLETVTRVIEEESANPELVDHWRFQVTPRIRKRINPRLDESSREREAEQTFASWRADESLRSRLVSSKELRRHALARIKGDLGVSCNPNSMFERMAELTEAWSSIAAEVFPGKTWIRLPETPLNVAR